MNCRGRATKVVPPANPRAPAPRLRLADDGGLDVARKDSAKGHRSGGLFSSCALAPWRAGLHTRAQPQRERRAYERGERHQQEHTGEAGKAKDDSAAR